MRIHVPGAVAAAVCMAALTACGGGSGGGTAVSLHEKYRSYADGNPTFELSESESVALSNRVARSRTHTTDGAHYSFDAGAGTWSLVDDGFYTYPDGFDPSDIVDSLPEGFTVSPVLEHNGVRLFKIEGDIAFTPEIEDGGPARVIAEQYSAYLEFGGFEVVKTLYCSVAGLSSCDESSIGISSSLSIYSESSGHFSGSDPTGRGSAVWTGVMTGVDVARSGPGTTHRVLGDARIDIDDLSDPNVDVAFTGIRDLASGAARSDMTWNDLALTDGGFSDGSFSIGDGGVAVPPPPPDGSPSQPPQPETIRGVFHGPAHQEVGGVFDRDGIAGAFGAKRR